MMFLRGEARACLEANLANAVNAARLDGVPICVIEESLCDILLVLAVRKQAAQKAETVIAGRVVH